MLYPQQFWDDRYGSNQDYVYGTQPNAFLKEQLALIPQPGRLLLLAEGEGRNAVHAAEQGWQVTAVDFSEKGREKALALAASRGVQLEYQVMDVRDFDFEKHGPFDAIGLVYAHFPEEFRGELFAKCLSSLHPGGKIILEVFSPAQLNYSSGGPKDLNLLVTPDQLKMDFANASSLEVADKIIQLDEGPGHTGSAAVVRCVAVR